MKILYRYTEIIIGSLYPMEMCLFRHGGTTEVQVRDSLKGGKCISVKFFPEKFRLMLEYYWDMEETQPEFYEEAVSKYGKYLDKEGITAGFYQKRQSCCLG